MRVPLKVLTNLALVSLTACSGVVYEYNPATQKVVEKARPSSWDQLIYSSIDSHLSDEMQGRRPSGGKKNWDEFWRASISMWRSQRSPQYEEYLLRRRKELGLR